MVGAPFLLADTKKRGMFADTKKECVFAFFVKRSLLSIFQVNHKLQYAPVGRVTRVKVETPNQKSKTEKVAL